MLSSNAACTPSGPGAVFVQPYDSFEAAKVTTARFRPADVPGSVGDVVTIEATLDKVEDRRFSHVSKAVVLSVNPMIR